ncbi:MAG: acyl-ACP thioesterase, partial [Firmicutes bacterium HGW-Firmicutes-18]
DVDSKKLCRITKDLTKAYGFTTKDRFSEKISFNNIPKLSEGDFETNFKIRYMDIANNLHVNNTKYLAWAIETVPYEIVTRCDLSHIDIVYRKEVKYGQSVKIITKIYEFEDKTELVHMVNSHDNDLLCQLKTIWQKGKSYNLIEQ